MCTHQKYVTNPYTGQRLFVKCGKCPSCLQEKADRLTSRLNNHGSDYEKVAVFSTLTYKEEFVPYVLKSDIENNNNYELPIYRDYTIRRFKNRFVVHPCHSLLAFISLVNEESGEVNHEDVYFHGNLWKKGRGYHPTKMGVIYYKDFQNFKKLLRTNLQREFDGRNIPVEIFGTSEYGETHYRPHFHLLVYAQQSDVAGVLTCICKSWRFSSNDDIRRSTQIGINPSAYVSSYINSPTGLPRCLTRLSPPKHSFTPSIGVKVPVFSLVEILAKVDKGTLSYCKSTIKDGKPCIFNVPIPKYVINRYFPLFKGLCRCSNNEVVELLRLPSLYFTNRKCNALTDYNKRFRNGALVNDIHTNLVRIQNAIKYYVNETGRHEFDFALDYLRVWNCFKNTVYKLSFEQEMPMTERYDNINDLIDGYVSNDTLSSFLKIDTESDCNKFSSVKCRTEQMSNKYFAKCKISKTNNYIRSTVLNKDL